MTAQDEEDNGSPSRERANLLAANGGGSGRGLVEMFVPTSPGRGLHYHDDDLNEDKHMLSDHFEMEDGDSYSDDGSLEIGGDPHGMAVGSATPTQVAINIFISFVGAGLLGLPYAFSRSGWLLGSLSLCAVSATNVYAMLLLVKCRKRLEQQGVTGIKGYGGVGREVLGAWGEVVVNVCLVISQAGFATAYLIFIGANIHKVTNGMASRAMIIYACVPLLSLLVQFRNMKTLSPFSLIADVANVLGFSCVLFQDFEYYTHDDNIELVDFRGLIYVTSVCIYSLEGVGLILPLESSCADREGFPRLLKRTITGITILMAVFGTCGYVAFGNQTISPISLNLKGESASFVQVALCLALYLTYPIMMFPVSDVLENLILSDSNKPPRRFCPSRTVRVIIVLVTATIAYILPNFGKFLELVGASICTLLGFILPCFFHLRVFGRKEMKMWEVLFNVFIIVVAVFFAFVGTIEAILKLLEGEDEATEGNVEL
jgi:proton-coupled amino acid transporter